MGGLITASFPAGWKSQRGLAAELAALLEHVRENNPTQPSTQKVESLVQQYDLGMELARFQLKLEEVYNGMRQTGFPRDMLRGLIDALSESAWWLLQAYSREELRSTETPAPPHAQLLAVESIRPRGLSDSVLESSALESGVEPDSTDSSAVDARSNLEGSAASDNTKDDSDFQELMRSSQPQHHQQQREAFNPVKQSAKAKQSYVASANVLVTLEERLMLLVTQMQASLAITPDSKKWGELACSGPKSQQMLLRELELCANDPTTRDLGSRLFSAVEGAFDQYTGIRQINDFRGLPDCGFSLPEANQLIQRVYERTLAAGLQTMENLELVDEQRLAAAFEGMCANMVKEYKAFKAGVLTKLGCLSSLHEMDRGRNLNSSIVLEYIRQVMAICDQCVEQVTASFNERVQQVDLLRVEKQNEIYSAMGGRQELGHRVRAHLFQIKPWARESIQLQTESLLQREVFGKSRGDILATLNASKEQMLTGFRALTEGKIPEPLNRLDEIIAQLDAGIEAVLGPATSRKGRFGKAAARPGGKTSRGRKQGRLGVNDTLVISGQTIRGNKFTDADMEEFALEAGTAASIKK